MSVTTAFGFLGTSGLLPTVLGAVGLTLLWFVASSVLAWSKLRHIPGPLLASFSNTWAVKATYTGRLHQILDEGHKKYGKVMRVAPDAVAIFDPETCLRITSARSPYTRGAWYSSARLDHRGNTLFTELDVAKHGKRKPKLAASFSGKNVALLETKLDKWLAALISSIRVKIAQGEETIDFGTLIQYFQVDLISELMIGQPWGDLADETDHFGYLHMADNIVPTAQSLLLFPLARKILSSTWFIKLFGPKTTDTSGTGLFMGFVFLSSTLLS